jgi:hypothetical protein
MAAVVNGQLRVLPDRLLADVHRDEEAFSRMPGRFPSCPPPGKPPPEPPAAPVAQAEEAGDLPDQYLILLDQ